MPSLSLVRVHEEDAVREIIEKAWSIVDGSTVPEGLRIEAFEKACDLLAARIPLAQPDGPLDLAPFRNGR